MASPASASRRTSCCIRQRLRRLLVGAVLATVEFNLWRAMRRIAARVAQPVYALGDTVAVTAMLAFSVLNIAAGSYSPFLYFRF